MMKFFRKHNKKLLAVFMALLLVVWLGGSALQSIFMPSESARVIAHTSDGDIVAADQLLADLETQILGRLGIPWQQPRPDVRVEPLTLIDWILLTREAKRYGIMSHAYETESVLARVGLGKDQVYQLARQRDIKPQVIYDALGKFMSVQRMIALADTSVRSSEADLRVAARDEFEKAKVNLVTLGASNFIDPEETFTDDEIRAHFEKYRDREAGVGMNFGYFQPARVQAEYIKVDVKTVAANVRVGERALETKAMEFWRDNPTAPAFRRPPEPEKPAPDAKDDSTDDAKDASADDDAQAKTDDGEKPADADAEATSEDKSETKPEETSEENADAKAEGASEEKPEDKPRSPYFETWSEARDAALDAAREQIAKAQDVRNVANWLLRKLTDPWLEAPVGEDGYKVAPKGVNAPGYYDSVVASVPNNLRYGDALTVGRTEFFSQAEGWTVPEIGKARLEVGKNTSLFRDMAFLVQGVATIPDDPGADTSVFLAIGQTASKALTDPAGDMFVYRIVGVEPAGPPDSADEIRDQIVEDLRLQRAFDRAHQAAERLAASVTGDGLKAAFDADEGLVAMLQPPSGYLSPAPFGRTRPGWGGRPEPPEVLYLSNVGIVPYEFVQACFALEDKPEGHRVGVIPDKRSANVAVVEWVGLEPLRVDQLADGRGRLLREMNRYSVSQALGQWLDPQRIRDRNGFAWRRSDQ